MQTVPLTPEEKQKLQNLTFKGSFVALAILVFVGFVAYFIISTLDRDMFFIAYFIWAVLGFILFAIGYQAYNTWQDLRIGTKKVFQTHIADKQHTITQSTSGTGNNRTTTTHHYYYFELENYPRLTVSEAQYELFKQGQHIQVEKLSYSDTLWDILLITDSGEILPAQTLKKIHQPHNTPIQTEWLPLEANEIAFLNRKQKINIFWAIFSIIWISFLIWIPIFLVSLLFYRWFSVSNYQALLIASCISLAYVMRRINHIRANYQKDLADGIEVSRLLLVDKEIINSGGITCRFVFENNLCIGVPAEVYEKAENQQYYWVGKSKSLFMPLYLQDEDKQNKWQLYA